MSTNDFLAEIAFTILSLLLAAVFVALSLEML